MKNNHSMKTVKAAVSAFVATLALFAVTAAIIKQDNVSAAVQQEKGRRVARNESPWVPTEHVQPEQIRIDNQARISLIEGRSETAFTNHWLNNRVVRFDVTENAKRFVFDETPLFPDGAPAYGNEFVTEGYIYPYGTLSASNGVNPDGSPEFPDKVIGRWVCRGWHTGEGAKTATGPWVVTHQIYDFGVKPGQLSITTDGFELVDLNEPILRAVTGGTGPYSQTRGEATQTMIGFNQLSGVNLRLEIRITK